VCASHLLPATAGILSSGRCGRLCAAGYTFSEHEWMPGNAVFHRVTMRRVLSPPQQMVAAVGERRQHGAAAPERREETET